MQHRPSLGPMEWALLLFLSFLWGGAFFLTKVTLHELPPFTIVLFRVAMAALALAAYLRLTGRAIPRSRTVWGAFFGMGLINSLIPFNLLFWGQTVIDSSLASILNAMTPVFSILAAHAFTSDEKMTSDKIAGVVLGISGVVILMGVDAVSGSLSSLVAMLACLGAALSYGLASVFGRRFRRLGIAPAIGAFGQVAATTVMMVPIALVFDQPWRLQAPSATVWAALFALALLSTALAYVIFFRILSVGGATNSSLVTLLVPVSAILLGSVILGERLAPNHIAGMVLIALGLVAIDGRAWRFIRPPAPAEP